MKFVKKVHDVTKVDYLDIEGVDNFRIKLKEGIFDYLTQYRMKKGNLDRKSTRLNSSHKPISYAV